MTKISIIIPVYNNIQYTVTCLKSIEKHTPQNINYDVVVVDDCSTDRVEDILPRMVSAWIKKRLTVVTNKENLGFGQSIHRGVKEATGNILLFLNNDVFVTDGWLYPLLSALDREGDIIGAKLVYPDSTIQHAGGVFYYDERQNTILPYHIYRGFYSNFIGVNKRRRFNWITFACVLLKRYLFEDLGGFDKTFINSYEDVDLCMRAIEKGYSILYEPASVSYHMECGTRGYGNSQDIINHQLFLDKHKIIHEDDFRYYIEDGIPIEYGREFSIRLFPESVRRFPFRANTFMEVLSKNI